MLQKRIEDKMIAVIGSGCWATALVKILLENKQRTIHWWVRSKEVCDCLSDTGHNPRHLPELQLDSTRIHVNTDLAATVAANDILILAVPSAHITGVLSQLPVEAYKEKRFVSAVKGYVPQQKISISQYLERHLQVPPELFCVISGPSHAEEVAAGKPTFLTVASTNSLLAQNIASLLTCSYIHTSTSNEVHVIELCGLSKNVYAIAAGLAIGLGYGDNLIAVITAAAAHELQNIIPNTTLAFRLLSDLMVTCFSRHSRNRSLGEAVAHGVTPSEHFLHTGMVAEGYYSAAIMHDMDTPCPIPIAETVYNILYLGADPRRSIEYLINNIL